MKLHDVGEKMKLPGAFREKDVGGGQGPPSEEAWWAFLGCLLYMEMEATVTSEEIEREIESTRPRENPALPGPAIRRAYAACPPHASACVLRPYRALHPEQFNCPR